MLADDVARTVARVADWTSLVPLSWHDAPTCPTFNKMRNVIVAGGTNFADYTLLTHVLRGLLHPDDVIISGCAPGADSLGIKFAQEFGWKYETFPADWANDGKYEAGFIRNSKMVACANALIAFWDGQSGGTRDTIFKALEAKREVHVYMVKY